MLPEVSADPKPAAVTVTPLPEYPKEPSTASRSLTHAPIRPPRVKLVFCFPLTWQLHAVLNWSMTFEVGK